MKSHSMQHQLSTLELVELLIKRLSLEASQFHFISHSVTLNWRQRFLTTEKKLENLDTACLRELPQDNHFMSGQEVTSGGVEKLRNTILATSICSKFKCNGNVFHLPIMNLHPEFEASPTELLEITSKIQPMQKSGILTTGRFYHYMGDKIIPECDWPGFLSSFLMPTILVSPRYIGHSLYHGFAPLRLFPYPPLKPCNPKLVAGYDQS